MAARKTQVTTPRHARMASVEGPSLFGVQPPEPAAALVWVQVDKYHQRAGSYFVSGQRVMGVLRYVAAYKPGQESGERLGVFTTPAAARECCEGHSIKERT